MIKKGIVLGNKISANGIEVDRAKVEIIEKLPSPMNKKGMRSYLGYAGFYCQFIREFSKISKPLSNLLMKNVPFDFSYDCLQAFEILKKELVSTPINEAPNWSLHFEIMCDVIDFELGMVLG